MVPNLRIFNAKPTEINKRKKFSKDDTLSKIDPSLQNISEVEADKEVKRKKSKKDVKISEKNISMSSSEHVHALPVNDEGGKEKRRKKSEKDVARISNLNQNKVEVAGSTDPRPADNAKIKKFENEEVPLFMDIRDIEALSGDRIFDGKTSQNSDKGQKGHKASRDEKKVHGLIIEHKKKGKGTGLQLFNPKPKIGLGGPSSWDD